MLIVFETQEPTIKNLLEGIHSLYSSKLDHFNFKNFMEMDLNWTVHFESRKQ